MDEYGFVDMILTGNYNKSLKLVIDKIVIYNSIRLYNIFKKHNFINERPNLIKYIKKLSKNKEIYRDVYGIIQNVIIIRKLNLEDMTKFWNILKQYRRLGCSEKYNFTYGELIINHKNNFGINETNFLYEMKTKLDSINFTFHYNYDNNTIIGFEAYQIPIIIVMECD